MREWLYNLICKTNSDEAVAERAFEDELQSKINSIKKRIAVMERTIGRRNRSDNNPQAPSECMVEQAQRSKRNHLPASNKKQTQSDLLKAKLMGRNNGRT